MNQEIELAWAAGFFDGEGYVGCVKHSSHKQATYMRLTCTISQVDRQVLDRFQKAVGIGVVRGPYQGNGRNSNPSFQWSAGKAQRIGEVWVKLRPYLSPIKQAQFEKALTDMDEYRQGAHQRRVESGYMAAAKRWGYQREGEAECLSS